MGAGARLVSVTTGHLGGHGVAGACGVVFLSLTHEESFKSQEDGCPFMGECRPASPAGGTPHWLTLTEKEASCFGECIATGGGPVEADGAVAHDHWSGLHDAASAPSGDTEGADRACWPKWAWHLQ